MDSKIKALDDLNLKLLNQAWKYLYGINTAQDHYITSQQPEDSHTISVSVTPPDKESVPHRDGRCDHVERWTNQGSARPR